MRPKLLNSLILNLCIFDLRGSGGRWLGLRHWEVRASWLLLLDCLLWSRIALLALEVTRFEVLELTLHTLYLALSRLLLVLCFLYKVRFIVSYEVLHEASVVVVVIAYNHALNLLK